MLGAQPVVEPSVVRSQIIEDVTSSELGVVDIDSFDSTLYFLDESEIAYLKGEIEREYTQNLGKNVSALLLDTFESCEESEVRVEVIGVLDRLLPRLLEEGNFSAAIYLVTEVSHVMRAAPALEATHRKALFQLTERLSQPDSLSQLFEALEYATALPSSEEFATLLVQLRPEALAAVLKWLGAATDHPIAPLVSTAVEQTVTNRPSALAGALGDTDSAVLAQALRLFRKTRPKECVKPVVGLSAHPHDGIRLLVAEALVSVGNAAACASLTRMIDDEFEDVRMAALGGVAMRGWTRALPRIRATIDSPAAADLSVAEQRAFFKAFGTLAGDDGVAVLRSILRGKTRAAKRSPELRACAAVGLGKIGTPVSRGLLLKASKDRNPVVKTAATGALYDGD